ncbi:zinc finger protein 567 [Lampris incognitus]|uniref:zinc finger protein 567 n=1 Tax=Lampris incognitus TaxID=2546036 RepID=UPI0024B5A233|nr:zinc finger protein 567 [Lampris incognitus]
MKPSMATWGGNSAGGDGKRLVCNLCPPPGKLFKKMAGLSVHLKLIHYKERKKDYFCGMCRKLCRNQLDLDAHTRRHANQMAVYQCSLCPFKSTDKLISGLSGRYVMKKHLESEHSGIIPSCQICNRNFKNLTSYLSDQFRHVGISPFYCPKCKIYEMTERGLVVHLRNDKLKNRREGAGEDEEEMEEQEEHASRAENSATDDSDS